jgi:hypothetical protein
MVQLAADGSSQIPAQTTPSRWHYSVRRPQTVNGSFFTSMKLHFASCRNFGYSNDILFAFFTTRKSNLITATW